MKSDLLVVVGTPYKNETAILKFALALYGVDGLPKGEYAWQPRQEDCFVTGNMGYGDDRYRAVEEFVVSADLTQAVGRTRPLQNEVKVYVISNAPLPGWEVTKFMASELFDLRRTLRRDAADKYQQYAEEVIRRLDDIGWVGNPKVCAAVGVLPRTGRNYMTRFKEQYRDRIDVDGSPVRTTVELHRSRGMSRSSMRLIGDDRVISWRVQGWVAPFLLSRSAWVTDDPGAT